MVRKRLTKLLEELNSELADAPESYTRAVSRLA